MDDFHIPKISPEQLEYARKFEKQQKKDVRRKWLKDNFLALIAILIALVSLITMILFELLPAKTEPASQEPNVKNVQRAEENFGE